MFKINKSKNRVNKIPEKTFSELNMTERNHLQELIVNNPEILVEDFLIIQKEFNGFDDTNERLDLLALDKDGNLVIIENKLDDSGKDVTWQIIKYASYCSTLTKNEILEIYQKYLKKYDGKKISEEELLNFFDVENIKELSLNEGSASQRLILVAANFRKEITSSVLWLMKYGLKIQCIKATPFQMGEELILKMEQIIPVKDVEELTIKMAEKEKEEEKTREFYRSEVREYSIEHHTNNKSENNIKRFKEIQKYILDKDEKIIEVIRKVYVAYKEVGRKKNLFELEFKNRDTFYIKFSKELREDGFLKEQVGVEDYFSSTYQRENRKGNLAFSVDKKEDVKIVKKLIDHVYKKLK